MCNEFCDRFSFSTIFLCHRYAKFQKLESRLYFHLSVLYSQGDKFVNEAHSIVEQIYCGESIFQSFIIKRPIAFCKTKKNKRENPFVASTQIFEAIKINDYKKISNVCYFRELKKYWSVQETQKVKTAEKHRALQSIIQELQ